jgi:LmbE family N-acetylglucosaminyl deacetylase
LESETGSSKKRSLIMAKIIYFFISPHLDDVVLSCGGYIRRLTAAGEQVVIATVNTGDAPTGMPISRMIQRRHNLWRLEKAPFKSRCQEDAAANTLLGTQYIHLGLLDAIYRHNGDDKPLYTKRLVNSPVHPYDWINYEPILRQKIHQALSSLDGLDVQIFCPLAIGEHVDHIIVRFAVEHLCEPQSLIYYEDFPYVVKLDATWSTSIMDGKREIWQSTTYELTPAEIDARIAAVACYVSQIPKMFPSSLQRWQQRMIDHLPIVGHYLNWPTGLDGACKRMDLSIRSYIDHVGGERYWTKDRDHILIQESSKMRATL